MSEVKTGSQEEEVRRRPSFNKQKTVAEMFEENKTKLVKDTVIEWAGGTTPHGLANVFINQNLFLKVVWLFLLVGSVAYCVQQMVVMIQEFVKYKVRTEVSIVNEAPTFFPAVNRQQQSFSLSHL